MSNIATKKQTQFFIELNDFNVICCLLVVLIHVLSLGITEANPLSWQGALIFFPWLFARCAVPGFLFVGGMKVGLSFAGGWVLPYSTYLKRRIKKVYIPYLCWNVAYYVCFLPVGYVSGSLSEFVHYLWFGSLSAQFYYVIVILQFYLLRPIWHGLLRYISWFVGVPAAFLIMLAVGVFQTRAAAQFPTFAPYQGRICLSYLFYWVVGLYAGKYYQTIKVRSVVNNVVVALAVLVVEGYICLSYLEYLGGFFEYGPAVLEVLKPIFNLVLICLLLCVCQTLSRCWATSRRIWDFLYRGTLSVYFSHCLILTVGTAVLRWLGVTRLLYLLTARMLSAYLCSFFIYWMLNTIQQVLLPKTRLFMLRFLDKRVL